MLRGRHRGLPDALDRAVLLPREFSQKHLSDNTNIPQANTTTHYEGGIQVTENEADLSSPVLVGTSTTRSPPVEVDIGESSGRR